MNQKQDTSEGTGRPAIERRRFRITGRVQGVGFRAFVRRSARALGLIGFVRNEPDDSVIAEAQGTSAALAEFELRLKTGPALSRVDAVVAIILAVREDEIEFVITDR